MIAAAYLADGLRAWKEDSSGNRTYYLYDGTAPLAELNTTDRLITFVTFGPNGLISRRKGVNSIFYTYDFTGSVATATDGNGNVLGDVALNAVGLRESAYSIHPVDFCGQWGYHFDDECDLVLAGHRYYDRITARFLTRDPIGYRGGINLYGYVKNNFVDRVDPSGHMGIFTPGSFYGPMKFINLLLLLLSNNVANQDDSNDPPDPPSVRSTLPPGDDDGEDDGIIPVSCPINRGGKGGPGTSSMPSPASAPGGDDSGSGDAGGGGGGVGSGSGPYDPTPPEIPSEPGVAPDGGGCVAGDTPVVMADGTLKPIALVQAGDMILTVDPDTNRIVAQRVLNTESVLVADTYIVSFSDGEKIEMSREHPLYVTGRGFVHASEFCEGLECSTISSKSVTVTGITPVHHLARVFGLRVLEFQNYFVGEAAIRTHK